MKIRCDVAAKINLNLKITGKIGEMHSLDSLVCSVDIYDTVVVSPRSDAEFKIYSESKLSDFRPERFNKLIRSAADKFKSAYSSSIGDDFGADIAVFKKIPLGAGLGGSSASVAGTVTALGRLAELKTGAKKTKKTEILPLEDDFLLTLGSDVPFMAKGGRARVTGVGEKTEILPFEKQYFVIIAPRFGVDSGEAYKLYDRLSELRAFSALKEIGSHAKVNGESLFPDKKSENKSTDSALTKDTGGNASAVGEIKNNTRFSESRFENDLKEAAFILNPDARAAHEALLSAGAERVVLSGSGSASAAVFYDKSAAVKFAQRLDGCGNIYTAQSAMQKDAMRITIL